MLKNKITIIFLIALAVRIIFCLFIQEYQLPADGIGYDQIAQNIDKFHEFSYIQGAPTVTRAPVYPLFLAFLYHIFGHFYLAVVLIQALIDSITCVLIYKISSLIFNRESYASITAFMYALYPAVLVYVNSIISETIFTFIFMLSVYFLIVAVKKDSNYQYMLSGLLLGTATLIRGTTLAFPLIILFFMIIYKAKIYKIIFIISAMLIIMVPWTLRNYILLERIVPVGTIGPGLGIYTSGIQASKQGSYEEGLEKGRKLITMFDNDETGYENYLKSEGMKMIKTHPISYIFLLVKRFPRFWWTSHSGLFGINESISCFIERKDYQSITYRLLLLALQGIILLTAAAGFLITDKSNMLIYLPVFIVFYFTGHILFDPCPRYGVPSMPFIFLFSSITIFYLTGKIKGYFQ